MPRTVRDSSLETRTARSRLKARDWPYYRALDPGLHLGYRKPLSGSGTWLRRRREGADRKSYKHDKLGIADDFSDPDGIEVLSYAQAQRKAREHRVTAQAGYTVADAMDAYLAHLEAEGRGSEAVRDTRYRDRAFIRPKLGALELAALTADRLRRWRNDLAKAPARLRTAPGATQNHRSMGEGEDNRRARRATANRTWTVLRRALNVAFENDKIDSDRAWRKVKPFRGVETARVRYLVLADVRRVDNAMDPAFRPVLRGALHTGARYGGLIRLVVADFNPDAGTLRLRSRKGDGSEKIFHAHLTKEAQHFFAQLCAGRSADSPIFVRPDGTPWRKSHQTRPMQDASARAGITPAVNFNVMRHTFASHAIMNGTPLLVVAKTLGHTDTRMVEKHYGHLAPSYVADAIRAGAPQFDFKQDRRVVTLSGR